MTSAREGNYVVEEVRADGSLVVMDVETWEEERQQPNARDATEHEWQGFLAEHGRHMQPPDGEG